MQRESNRSKRCLNLFFGKFRLSSVRTVNFVRGTGSNYGIYGPFLRKVCHGPKTRGAKFAKLLRGKDLNLRPLGYET